MIKLVLLVVTMLCIASVPASAQQVARLRVGMSARLESTTVIPSRAATHWKTGAVVGAALGVAAVIFAVGAGSDGGSASLSEIFVLGSIGILVGGVPGALIGGLFKK